MKKVIFLLGLIAISLYATDLTQWKQNCKKNDYKACDYLGYKYHFDHKLQDYKKSLLYYTKACDGNIPSACDSLGEIYQHGFGIKRDVLKARELYDKACKLDKHGFGCQHYSYMSGFMYEFGISVQKDYYSAANHYENACKLGHNNACFEGGNIYKNKLKDYKSATKLYQRACNDFYSKKCKELGIGLR